MFQKEDFTVNPVTGSHECKFNAKLTHINENNVLTNSKGTPYRICKIEFTNASGNTEESSAMLYEANYEKGLIIGDEYICTLIITERESPLIIVSPLVANANRAKATAFGSIAAQLQRAAAAKVQPLEVEPATPDGRPLF